MSKQNFFHNFTKQTKQTNLVQAQLSNKYHKSLKTVKVFGEINVHTVISDRKISVDNSGSFSHYIADIVSTSDYYPFGMQMPDRDFSSDAYRYGFNGMEKDDEVKGSGNSYTTEFRQLDVRLGRWLSLDPVTHPFQSPYCAFDNNPIYLVDPAGANSEDPPRTHTTKSGDTYSALAKKYDVTVNQLREWNGYEDTKIPIGADLIVSNPNIETETDNNSSDNQNELKSFMPAINTDFLKQKKRSISPVVKRSDSNTSSENINSSSSFLTNSYRVTSLFSMTNSGTYGLYLNSEFKFKSFNSLKNWRGGINKWGHLKFGNASKLSWHARSSITFTKGILGVNTVLGGLNYLDIISNYRLGNYDKLGFGIELINNSAGTWFGVYSLAWTAGWESGRFICTTNKYLEFKYWFQKDVLNWDVEYYQMRTADSKGPVKFGN